MDLVVLPLIDVIVYVNTPLTVNAGQDISVCSNANNATITAIAAGGTSPYTYEWFANGISIGTQVSVNIAPASTTKYTIVIKDSFGNPAGGCSVNDKIVVTVNQAQSFDVCAPPEAKWMYTKIIGGELTELYKNTNKVRQLLPTNYSISADKLCWLK
ncbi:MAG: SprB repeat-containing protein [Cytophagales bacterium]|nr:SprB repeat-containing protein [Cytophagales bacterium]